MRGVQAQQNAVARALFVFGGTVNTDLLAISHDILHKALMK